METLILPRPRIIVPRLKSCVKLLEAFGLGTGTTLFDKSRYRSHGTIVGADWAAGLHGYCLDFDKSVPDYVEIPSTYTQLNFTSEDFSIIARVYLDSLTAFGMLYTRGLLSTDGIEVGITATGRLWLSTNQYPTRQITQSSDGDIASGAWYTMGFSRDGAAVALLRNGVPLTVTAGTHVDPGSCGRNARIGIRDDESSNPLDGKVEFFAIFGGVALAASEHLAWHNALA